MATPLTIFVGLVFSADRGPIACPFRHMRHAGLNQEEILRGSGCFFYFDEHPNTASLLCVFYESFLSVRSLTFFRKAHKTPYTKTHKLDSRDAFRSLECYPMLNDLCHYLIGVVHCVLVYTGLAPRLQTLFVSLSRSYVFTQSYKTL